MPEKHPAFLRAAALIGPMRSHFPTTSADAEKWQPIQRYRALARRVLVVAQTRVECQWSAYVDAVPGYNHEDEWQEVLHHGAKAPEGVARALFPEFDDVQYAW